MVEANKHIFVKHFFGLMRSMTSSSQSQQTAEDWFNKSVALHDQDNYADAIQSLDKAISYIPYGNAFAQQKIIDYSNNDFWI